MRMAVEDAPGFRDTYNFQHAQGFGACCRHALALMQAYRFGDLLADREYRIERGHRFLENHGDFRAADTAHGALIGAGQVDNATIAPLEIHAGAGDPAAAVVDQAHDRLRRHRFSRAGFTDDGQRFTRIDMERQIAYRFHLAFGSGKANAHLFHRQYPAADLLVHRIAFCILRINCGIIFCICCIICRLRSPAFHQPWRSRDTCLRY